MVFLLLYCPPGALSHRSHRLHHGEAGFRRHHRWWWLVWRWPRAPSGKMGWIWLDLRSDWFRKCVGFFGGVSRCYHMKWWSEMTILFVRGCSTAENEQNPKLPNHAKVYAQRKKKHVTPWGASQKSKQVIQHHRNQSQLRTFPKTVVGFDGLQQCLVIHCFLTFLLSMSPSIFYTLTFWRCPSCWVCFDSLQPVLHQFFLQLPFSPSSNLIPLRHLLRRFHHQSRWICSAEGPGTLITWCCHGVDESIAFKHVRRMSLDGSWQSQSTQKNVCGEPIKKCFKYGFGLSMINADSLW